MKLSSAQSTAAHPFHAALVSVTVCRDQLEPRRKGQAVTIREKLCSFNTLMRLAINATSVTRSIHVDYGGGKVR